MYFTYPNSRAQRYRRRLGFRGYPNASRRKNDCFKAMSKESSSFGVTLQGTPRGGKLNIAHPIVIFNLYRNAIYTSSDSIISVLFRVNIFIMVGDHPVYTNRVILGHIVSFSPIT